MAVDVPFESVQEITLKLARYEELFKYRYTEKDEGYRQTTQRPPRWRQVPVMHPWPPRNPYQRRGYKDWDSKHGYHHRSRERGRGGYPRRPRWDYHDDYRPHPPSSWRHRSRSPRPDMDPYRDRSPRRSPHHLWGRDSPSPRHHPRTPPRHPSPTPHDYGSYQRSRSRSRSPSGRLLRQPNSPRGEERICNEREGDVTVQEKEKGVSVEETKEDLVQLGDSVLPTSLLDLGFGDSELKVAPSDSDVHDILSSAHTTSNTVTSENLRHAQKLGQHRAAVKREKGRKKEKEGEKVAHSSKTNKQSSLPSSTPSTGLKVPSMHPSSSLLINHGKTLNVSSLSVSGSKDIVHAHTKQAENKQEGTTSQSLSSSSSRNKGKKKKPQIVISDESDNEEAVVSKHHTVVAHNSGQQRFSGEILTEQVSIVGKVDPDEEDDEIIVDDSDSGSLVLSLSKEFYSQSLPAEHQPTTLQSDTSATTYTAVPSESNATKLIIRSQGPPRSESPLTVNDDTEGGGRSGKEKKKKKRKKSKHTKFQVEDEMKPLQLKITIAKLDPQF